MHRWIHASTPAELGRRAEREQRIDAWWSAFSRHASAIKKSFRDQSFDVPAFMDEHLDAVDDRLFYEFGSADDLRDYLAITPEARPWLRPFVRTLLDRAPRLPGWTFCEYRPAVSPDHFAASMAGRTGHSAPGWTAVARVGEHSRIDIEYQVPSRSYDEEASRRDGLVATECLIGEEVLDCWIGSVDCTRKRDRSAVRLAELPAVIARLVEDVKRARPAHSYRTVAKGEWTILKLEPTPADDYPGQRDLFVAKTCDLSLWQAMLDGPLFSGRRFSRFGETFCYLKLDGSQVEDELFGDKSEIEDALEAALAPDDLGALIGGGTGLRYSYIDLALRDLSRAVQAILEVLRRGRVPLRSWIQFCDADMAAEWIGVYNDSPPPPRDGEVDLSD